MRRFATLLVVLAAAGCGSDSAPTAPSVGTSCPVPNRAGSYTLRLTQQSGDCGALTNATVTIVPPAAIITGCGGGNVGSWTSTTSCDIAEPAILCTQNEGFPAMAISAQRATIFEFQNVRATANASGSSISGTSTLRLYNGDPAAFCSGTYTLQLTRQ